MSFRNTVSLCFFACMGLTSGCSSSDLASYLPAEPSAPAAPGTPGIDPTQVQSYGFIWSRETGTQQIPLPPDAYAMVVNGISNTGQVVGFVMMSPGDWGGDGLTRAFSWSQTGGYLELGSLVGDKGFSAAVAVNNAGFVTGVSDGPSSIRSQGNIDLRDPFVWSAASGIKPMEGVSDISAILQVNAAGTVLGQSRGRYFLWNANTGVRTLASPAGPTGTACSIPVDLNNNGQVLRYSGVFAATGGCNTLSALTSDADGNEMPIDQWQCDVNHLHCGLELIAMNDVGEVAGNRPVLGITGLPDGGVIPFRWIPKSGFVQFPITEAHPDVRASDINEHGDIVGSVGSAAGGGGTAFVWMASGEVVKIPMPANTNWAKGAHINDKGQVVGTYR